jgi:hypothetical protein
VTTPDPDPDPDASVPASGLSDTEAKLVEAAAAGKFLTLRAGGIDLNNELHDPAAAPFWSDDHTIRAEVLAALLTGELRPSTRPPRYVMLRGAHITGSLNLMGATLACPVWLWDCDIDQPVNLNEATVPSIRMPGCRVPVLAADGLRTTGDLLLDDGFTASDEILLRGARIGGSLVLAGARITTLTADRISVDQIMSIQEASVHGQVSLTGARIGGQLNLKGARLVNPGGMTLMAERLSVGGNVFCADGFTAQGEVSLAGARIDGNLELSGAQLSNPGGIALLADSLTVTQCVFFENGFRAEGEVRMLSAKVGEAFSLQGATLTNPDGDALYAVRLTVEGDLYCRREFAAQGTVQLSGARISGVIDLNGAVLSHPGHRALDLYAASTAELDLLPRKPPDGVVDLSNAKVGVYQDDPSTWPATVLLAGFTYDSLHNDKADARDRLCWLARDPGGYLPQLYNQLESAYRRAGREDAARQVAIAKQKRRRQVFNPAGRLLNWVLYLTVGYGYRTWRAGAWLAVLTLLSTIAFAHIRMTPTAAIKTGFNPLGYSLDLLIPVADLGQKNEWRPDGGYQYLAWLLQALGWILTTAVVAAVTGVLRRD